MGREKRQGRRKNQLQFSEKVAGASFMILLVSILIYYFYQIFTM
jgi:hypothetical protein